MTTRERTYLLRRVGLPRYRVTVADRTTSHGDLTRTFLSANRAQHYERQLTRQGFHARTLTIHPR